MGIYQRDNLSSVLASPLESALARHQTTTDRQNKMTQDNIDAVARGAEGIAKDIYRDRLLRKLDELKAQREELDLQDEHDTMIDLMGDASENDYMGELADKLLQYKVDRDWDVLAGRRKPLDRGKGQTYLGDYILNGGLY